ncbi:hypothetical protein TNIN_329921 [Trichonephila inaurata madagascariensis]|uniref:Uncharacterized protein n=1 Tax=Trichonephila inaurata madagascariensis TaxID=2747483 RepID=A0A8X6JSV7_9ARAC|nr:hypothetical protein TNIN_329921 [Trichonephila inaurata madagascariensis]
MLDGYKRSYRPCWSRASVLFSTIAENICLGKPGATQEVIQATKLAHTNVLSFIEALPLTMSFPTSVIQHKPLDLSKRPENERPDITFLPPTPSSPRGFTNNEGCNQLLIKYPSSTEEG